MFDYRVDWSEEDREYVATVSEFPSLSFLAPTIKEALDGLKHLVEEVQLDLIQDLLKPDPWGQAELRDSREREA